MTLYERNYPASADRLNVYGAIYRGQVFKVGCTSSNVDHTITTIRIKARRGGGSKGSGSLPGTATMEVYAVDANKHPTGGALLTGTFNGNTINENSDSTVTVYLTGTAVFRKDTQYCFFVKAPNGDATNRLEVIAPGSNYPSVCGDEFVSSDSGTSWTTETGYDFWFDINGAQHYEEDEEGEVVTSGAFERDVYISGYTPRYKKSQIVGYHATSGDLRSIEINASGHLLVDIEVVFSSGMHVDVSGTPVTISGDHVFVESGVYVVADIAESGMGVQVQSGVGVLISGQHVYVESGVFLASGVWIAGGGSGQHVWISGQHVFVESGVQIVGGVQVSGAVQISGCVSISGNTVSISGNIIIVASGVEEACYSEIRTGSVMPVPVASGGWSLCPISWSGLWCSGRTNHINIKSLSGNQDIWLGGSGCKPYSGYGFVVAGGEEKSLDVCNLCNVYAVGNNSGDLLSFIGLEY